MFSPIDERESFLKERIKLLPGEIKEAKKRLKVEKSISAEQDLFCLESEKDDLKEELEDLKEQLSYLVESLLESIKLDFSEYIKSPTKKEVRAALNELSKIVDYKQLFNEKEEELEKKVLLKIQEMFPKKVKKTFWWSGLSLCFFDFPLFNNFLFFNVLLVAAIRMFFQCYSRNVYNNRV